MTSGVKEELKVRCKDFISLLDWAKDETDIASDLYVMQRLGLVVGLLSGIIEHYS